MAIRLKKYLKQNALYWEKTVSTGGKPVYAVNPVAIKVRWDDDMVEVITTTGRTITSKASLMCASEIKEGSVVFQGTVADWRALPTYPARPTPLQGGYEVILTGHTPDIKGREFLFTARL